jgi:hypothetical protein
VLTQQLDGQFKITTRKDGIKHIHTNKEKPRQLGQQQKFNKLIASAIMRREENVYTYIHIAYS